jgi:ubiquitin carboxyl-terminal hydrolase 16/45
MVKKKSTKNTNNDDSSSDCDEKTIPVVINNNAVVVENGMDKKCTHIQKSTDIAKLRKTLKEIGIRESCSDCNRKSAKADPADDDDLECEYDTTLWLCLRCSTQLCGRAKNEHALAHFKVRLSRFFRNSLYKLCFSGRPF